MKKLVNFYKLQLNQTVTFLVPEAATGGVLLRKGVSRNFTKFTGKGLCQILFFNKSAGLKPATLLKQRL